MEGDDDGEHTGGQGAAEARRGPQRGGRTHREQPAARRGPGGLCGHRAPAGGAPGRPAGPGQRQVSARRPGQRQRPRRRGSFPGVSVKKKKKNVFGIRRAAPSRSGTGEGGARERRAPQRPAGSTPHTDCSAAISIFYLFVCFYRSMTALLLFFF